MASSPAQPVLPPLLEQIQKTPADAQAASPFFARLPIEIRRMIYVEVWRTYGAPDPAADDSGADSEAATDSPDHNAWWWRTHGGSLTVHIVPVLAMGGQQESDGGIGGIGGDSFGFTSAPCFLGVDDVPDTAAPPEARDIRADRLAATRTSISTALVLLSQQPLLPLPPPPPPAPTSPTFPTSPASPAPVASVPHSVWQTRMDSPWFAHWPCEAHFTGAGTTDNCRRVRLPPRPFLPVLLTCRRAYIEAAALLYGALTFQFTDERTALAFVRRWPAVASVRLVVSLGTAQLYVHCPQTSRPDAAGIAGAAGAVRAVGADGVVEDTVWRQLLRRLADPVALPHLRHLRIWATAEPSWRPWHHVAVEPRLFAPLLDAAHLLARRAVVLYLPTLPAKHGDRNLPAWCFLDEEGNATTEEARPRPAQRPIVVRSPRHRRL